MSLFDDVGNAVAGAVDAVAGFLADVWEAITNAFSSHPAGAPVRSCQKALSEENAVKWFDHFRNDR